MRIRLFAGAQTSTGGSTYPLRMPKLRESGVRKWDMRWKDILVHVRTRARVRAGAVIGLLAVSLPALWVLFEVVR